jgi:hypothetical protein
MKYAVEMGSGSMIILYITSFIGPGIQKLIAVIHRRAAYFYFLFFQNKENRLKNHFSPK